MRIFLLICTIAIFSACNNTEIGKAKDVNPEAVYYDYKVWGEEGSENVTVMLQYRFGGEDGTSLTLDSPSKVSIDGEMLRLDSVKFSGAYYELIKPSAQFEGKHTILFMDTNGKEHKEEFTYLPFALAADLPEQLPRKPITLKLTNFTAAPTPVRLVMTDTAFTSNDVNEELKIEKGELKITARYWNALKAGPVTLEIYREEEQPLKKASKEGGRLMMTYALKRQFTLVD